MPLIDDYQVYIFDCDGVILDSNQLKIDAMEKTLHELGFGNAEVSKCIQYFRENFGKSRFHHVKVFIEQYLQLSDTTDKLMLEESLIENFSKQCKSLYQSAAVTPYFFEMLSKLEGRKYIASGSAQDELREVFDERGLAKHFEGIFGSPTAKAENIMHILTLESTLNAVMIGDAISDLDASLKNDIDFIGYTPYSNIPEKLNLEAKANGFNVIKTWTELT
ncbi:HAD family hydrolase [Leucothrix arctica]|uniref:phosphoglycolate phosphatase n=1 Tax=Leucothrix arctica TaxID=1481894 RepID=A0A317CK32_9GAMM|nr:HAD hydrolase-like protein [Leucothrix arctica]PWQ98689.1 HAD family hydrolase [Leucothrix arctica]